MSTMTCLIGVMGAGSEHTTSTDCRDAQAGSPSEAASITETRPVFVQVNVAPAVEPPARVPAVAVHA